MKSEALTIPPDEDIPSADVRDLSLEQLAAAADIVRSMETRVLDNAVERPGDHGPMFSSAI